MFATFHQSPPPPKRLTLFQIFVSHLASNAYFTFLSIKDGMSFDDATSEMDG